MATLLNMNYDDVISKAGINVDDAIIMTSSSNVDDAIIITTSINVDDAIIMTTSTNVDDAISNVSGFKRIRNDDNISSKSVAYSSGDSRDYKQGPHFPLDSEQISRLYQREKVARNDDNKSRISYDFNDDYDYPSDTFKKEQCVADDDFFRNNHCATSESMTISDTITSSSESCAKIETNEHLLIDRSAEVKQDQHIVNISGTKLFKSSMQFLPALSAKV